MSPPREPPLPATLERIVRRVFLATCWLPPALLLAYMAFVRATDGWGALAGVFLIIAAVWSSWLLGSLGVLLAVRALVRRAPDWLVLLGTLAAGSVAFWASVTR